VTGTLQTAASNAGGVGKVAILDEYLAIRLMTGAVRTTIATATMQFTAPTTTHL